MLFLEHRPEKDHAAQLHSLAELLKTHPEYRNPDTGVKLVLVGGSRNAGDAARIEGLRLLVNDLGIEVRFATYDAVPADPALCRTMSSL